MYSETHFSQVLNSPFELSMSGTVSWFPPNPHPTPYLPLKSVLFSSLHVGKVYNWLQKPKTRVTTLFSPLPLFPTAKFVNCIFRTHLLVVHLPHLQIYQSSSCCRLSWMAFLPDSQLALLWSGLFPRDIFPEINRVSTMPCLKSFNSFSLYLNP